MGTYLRASKSQKLHKKNHLKEKKVSSQATNNLQNQQLAKQQDPTTLQNIKAIVYNQDQRQPSEVEQNPNGYKYMGPFTTEQENKLFPRKIYQKDQQNYNMNEATPENIQDSKVLIVRNMTAAKEQFKNSKFFDEREQLDPVAKNIIGEQYKQQEPEGKYPVYQKDQKAYYNPINEKNIFTPQDNGLFMVPINLQEKPTDNEEVQKAVNRQRLAHKDSNYYDASALFEVPKVDPLQEALIESAKLNAQPKSQKLNDWVKQEDAKKEQVQVLLGRPIQEYQSDNRPNVITNVIKNLDIQKNRENAQQNPTPQIKANEQSPYYNAADKQSKKQ